VPDAVLILRTISGASVRVAMEAAMLAPKAEVSVFP